jgi:hypothetical protein
MSDANFIRGSLFLLQDVQGNLMYAWELRSQVEYGDHYLHEIAIFQGDTLVESHFFYNDVAGAERLPSVFGLFAWLGETVIIGIYIGIRKVYKTLRLRREILTSQLL